ncbi:3-oxoacyl-(acyl-carrier-protein) synthase [Flavobacterium indicum GPTSA100-9 = DSM 17447]|uniref:3-oxoacyl-(Acyl-carrier-protein) synthase n=1 Tax=Flavobacterium indicum (strain DSM 17447 / CIP 109464 / GPTSA100-9) TaxID=1094466 RepID=H8XRH6_FLAIG|nr:beta-ketoacyl synthase N-terminal-like domain-containing protein [Flavobacterium indicum]CCG54410.1 3-oxoacyl-(acyl-carrier-protein) synthase [Flavobacterium indicum GPTSA100-9 = DSM 17447]
MLKEPIYIQSCNSISALGRDKEEIWKNYLTKNHLFTKLSSSHFNRFVSKIDEDDNEFLLQIRSSDSKYKHIDRSVLMALYVSRRAFLEAKNTDLNMGINFGSSRGATELFEKYFEEFRNTQQVSTFTSPATTLGNIASWVAHDLQLHGPEISHSITCSTGLHAVLNGIAWLQAGFSQSFLVGASEASLTPFTLAQLAALKVYSNYEDDFPNKALDISKKYNSMILGEAAVALVLSKQGDNALGKIIGIGFATEILSSGTSISADALCFQKSMKMAIGELEPSSVDAIIMHAPGTIQGDLTEFHAIQKLFGKNIPLLTSNKWKVGHTFATSGLLSMELALLMLEKQHFISSPFYPQNSEKLRPAVCSEGRRFMVEMRSVF